MIKEYQSDVRDSPRNIRDSSLAIVIFLPKGGSRHRTHGYFYAIFLFSVNVSALSVYKESVGMGPFHILALISLVTLISGFIPSFLRRPVSSWLYLHAYLMSWSYVGLVAAGVAQIVTMSSNLPAWFAVGLPSILIVINWRRAQPYTCSKATRFAYLGQASEPIKFLYY